MKKLIFAAALLASVPAFAHDVSTDLICTVRDTSGNNLYYAFANNSRNIDGSFGGTYVETAFEKNGEPAIIGAQGQRPIWIYGQTRDGNARIDSRADPGWFLYVYNGQTTNGVWSASTTLYHNDRPVGSGGCARNMGQTAGNVPDLVD